LAKEKKRKKDKDKKARRKKPKSLPKGMAQCSPYLYYADPRAAIDWLCQALDLEAASVVPGDDGGVMHAELRFGKAVFMLGPASAQFGTASPRSLSGVNQSLYVYVDDVDRHCERARAAGAKIAAEPQEMFWGDRVYALHDCEGHHWTFAQHVRDPDPDELPPSQ
jgi:uncharacterized glyoxalase superfamily protein PhnB